MSIYKDENFQTIKNANTTNREGIHKKLFELPDRRMKIKNIRSSLPLVHNRDNFLLQQENFWLSSKFTLWKYIVQIFISSWFLFQASYKGSIKILTMLSYCIVNKVTHLPKLWTEEKLITFNITHLCGQIWWFYLQEMLDTDLPSSIYFLAWYCTLSL